MKRILLALTMLALFAPFARQAEAADVSLNFFYDNLSSQGNWIEVADYGYCFQPTVGVSDRNWRPYTDGYWSYTDVGWTWVSYEDFGWATYHYGRWTRLSDYGWCWVPGYEWGPSWVSWRTGGDYVGWAPLPPSGGRVYEGRAIDSRVDVEFDIGPSYYNFVDVRYIGEPVLRDRIFEPERNVTIINNTVNVTNITYNNSTVYNYGPDYNRLNDYSTRPIQRLALQRQGTVDASMAMKGSNLNRVEGGKLLVVAPSIQKSEQPIVPKMVKAKVEQPKIEHGWTGVAEKAKIQEHMKSENAQNVPAPTVQKSAKKGVAAESAAPAAAAAPAATTPLPPPNGKHKGKHGENIAQPAPAASAVPSAAAAEVTVAPEKPGKGKRNGANAAPGQAAEAPTAPGPHSTPAVGHRGGRSLGAPDQAPTPAAEQAPPAGETTTAPGPRGKRKGEHREQAPVATPVTPMEAAPAAPQQTEERQIKRRAREERAPQPSNAPETPRAAERAVAPEAVQRQERRRLPAPPEQTGRPEANAPQPQRGSGEGQQPRRKGKPQQEPSASPGPQ
jgi:hypothetical protein